MRNWERVSLGMENYPRFFPSFFPRLIRLARVQAIRFGRRSLTANDVTGLPIGWPLSLHSEPDIVIGLRYCVSLQKFRDVWRNSSFLRAVQGSFSIQNQRRTGQTGAFKMFVTGEIWGGLSACDMLQATIWGILTWNFDAFQDDESNFQSSTSTRI